MMDNDMIMTLDRAREGGGCETTEKKKMRRYSRFGDCTQFLITFKGTCVAWARAAAPRR